MAGGYGGKNLEEIYENYQSQGVNTDDLQAWVKGLKVDGDMVVNGAIEARHIQTDTLVVGENVSMGPNATITWENVQDAPSIPETAEDLGALSDDYASMLTKITSTGIYTGSITAGQINAGTLQGFIIKQVSSGGSITLDDNGLAVRDSGGRLSIAISIDTNQMGDNLGAIDLYHYDATNGMYHGGVISVNNQGYLTIRNPNSNGAFATFYDDGTLQTDKLMIVGGIRTGFSTTLIKIDSSGLDSSNNANEPAIYPTDHTYGSLGKSNNAWFRMYSYYMTSTSIGNWSTRKIKKDITDASAEECLAILDDIKLRNYKYKNEKLGELSRKERIGIVIEETENDRGKEYYVNEENESVDLYGLLSVTIGAVQTLNDKVKLLESDKWFTIKIKGIIAWMKTKSKNRQWNNF